MTMKSTDLQKQLGLKISSRLGAAGIPSRYGSAAGLGDKREQREQHRALGLMPFACKLPSALVKQLQEKGATHEGGINALMLKLLTGALAA